MADLRTSQEAALPIDSNEYSRAIECIGQLLGAILIWESEAEDMYLIDLWESSENERQAELDEFVGDFMAELTELTEIDEDVDEIMFLHRGVADSLAAPTSVVVQLLLVIGRTMIEKTEALIDQFVSPDDELNDAGFSLIISAFPSLLAQHRIPIGFQGYLDQKAVAAGLKRGLIDLNKRISEMYLDVDDTMPLD